MSLLGLSAAVGGTSVRADGVHLFDVRVDHWENSIRNLTYANEKWVGVSKGRILDSWDALNWKTRFSGHDRGLRDWSIRDVHYANETWVFVGERRDPRQGLFICSSDLVEFDVIQVPEITAITDVEFGDGRWMGLHENGLILFTNDLGHWEWEPVHLNSSSEFLQFTKRRWYTESRSSSDGLQWVDHSSLSGMIALEFDVGQWIGIRRRSPNFVTIERSTDSVRWEVVHVASDLDSLERMGGYWVVWGAGRQSFISRDGRHWRWNRVLDVKFRPSSYHYVNHTWYVADGDRFVECHLGPLPVFDIKVFRGQDSSHLHLDVFSPLRWVLENFQLEASSDLKAWEVVGVFGGAKSGHPICENRIGHELTLGSGSFFFRASRIDEMIGRDLKGANLSGASQLSVAFDYSDLGDAVMQNGEYFDWGISCGFGDSDDSTWPSSFVGARLEGAWLQGSSFLGSNFSLASMGGVDAEGASFSSPLWQRSLFFRTDLSGSNLKGCSFRNADLTEAILSDANMEDVDLRGAVLRGAKGFDPNQAGIVFENTVMPDGSIRK